MKDTRSASQILYGFLPEQTVDVKKGVWKVKKWRTPKIERNVDLLTLRRELCRIAAPWRATGLDGDFVHDLERNCTIQVLSLDRDNGVELEPFPQVWMCKKCNCLHSSKDKRCPCGHTLKGQLPFVGYHDKCGAIKQPSIPKCNEHGQSKIIFPGTATATEIKFVCPICNTLLRTGFGFPMCECGQGRLSFNVHRSSSVYTPRSIVIVNPPSPDKIRALSDSGGRAQALSWVINGMNEAKYDEGKASIETLRQQLISQKFPSNMVDSMIKAAVESGDYFNNEACININDAIKEDAESQAVTIALAASDSRIRISDLSSKVDATSELGILYNDIYKISLKKAGLESVELIEKFPILSGHYGFTRGGSGPGESRLKAFRHTSGTYNVYADIAETEALFIKLSATRVAEWLLSRGHQIPPFNDDVSARISIINTSQIPKAADDPDLSVGCDLLTLIHSFSHKFVRNVAIWAGIDRNALSELLTPLHLGFYVYAVVRGDFVLGGLQAVFESELDKLLYSFINDEHRCPLDPGCSNAGGACVACLHLGEPSCRLYNRFLSRHTLYGSTGYLR